jgi:hypothetical protein
MIARIDQHAQAQHVGGHDDSRRFCEHIWPVRVSQSIAEADSNCVGSVSRTKPWRCLINECMISGMSFQCSSTTSVRLSSVT